MTVFHVIGHTQYLGTCRMHLFRDCGQLNKRRRDAHFVWGTREGTRPEIMTIPDWDGHARNICKSCWRRSAIESPTS